MPQKGREKGALEPITNQRQRAPKTGRLPEEPSVRKDRQKKEKPETNQGKVEQEAEGKLRSTVVDIDSVRDDEIKEENLGLLEAAEHEDGELKPEAKLGSDDNKRFICISFLF